jgi:CubicO group peptidase (beta-lactamase class C family)
MSNPRTATRRHALYLLASAPLVMLPRRSALAAPPRQWTIAGPRVEKLDGLDAAMGRFMQQYQMRAGSLAVARQGAILFDRAYTFAEPNYPVTGPASLFRLASVSKAFTAAVIYELAEAKLLDLDSEVFPLLGLDRAALPVQKVDPRLNTITIRHLLNHRGGWDSSAAHFDPVFSMRDIARKLGMHAAPSGWDIARFMVGEPLQFTPGTQDHYSNFGYLMLGIVAEKATKTDFFGLVAQRVTGPLGIGGVFAARTRKQQRLPGEVFYDQPGTGLTPEFPDRAVPMPLPYGGEGWLTESMMPGGGLAATASAVARMIGQYAVWGTGSRRARQMWARSGSIAGTSSFAASRPDGLDFCFIVNTRNFGGAPDPVGAIAKEIHETLDGFQNTGGFPRLSGA